MANSRNRFALAYFPLDAIDHADEGVSSSRGVRFSRMRDHFMNGFAHMTIPPPVRHRTVNGRPTGGSREKIFWSPTGGVHGSWRSGKLRATTVSRRWHLEHDDGGRKMNDVSQPPPGGISWAGSPRMMVINAFEQSSRNVYRLEEDVEVDGKVAEIRKVCARVRGGKPASRPTVMIDTSPPDRMRGYECGVLLVVVVLVVALLGAGEGAPRRDPEDTDVPPRDVRGKRHGGKGSKRIAFRPKLDLDKAVGRAACNYTVVWDVEENRVPRRIPKVTCKGDGVCQYNSTRRGCCTTLTVKLDVEYRNESGFFTRTEKFPMACACLKNPEGKAMSKVSAPSLNPGMPMRTKRRRNARRRIAHTRTLPL
ncbi:hypothetical protein AAG570_013583 [Ranatra chinensis]|uniref:Spaetzle domain-containing protein n=1 Tax=Ranatra chinensis TaxID=642074 RepID=A0ABD0YCW6_9HEMI